MGGEKIAPPSPDNHVAKAHWSVPAIKMADQETGFQFTPIASSFIGSIQNKSKETLELFDKWCAGMLA